MYKSILVLGLSALAVASPAWSSAEWGTTTTPVAVVSPTTSVWAESWSSTPVVPYSTTVTEAPVWTSTSASAIPVQTWASSSSPVAPAPVPVSTTSLVSAYTPTPTPTIATFVGAAGRVELGAAAGLVMAAAAFL